MGFIINILYNIPTLKNYDYVSASTLNKILSGERADPNIPLS